MQERRKAVGEIMAAMILLLIASLVGVLLFTSSIRASNEQGAILRDQYREEGNSAQERFEVIYAKYENTNGKIFAWIYNYGKLDCEIIGIYVDGKPIQSQSPSKIIVNTGEIVKIEIKPENFPNSSYKIICISERGVKNESNWSI